MRQKQEFEMFKVEKPKTTANISRTIRFPEELFVELTDISIKEDVSFNSLVLQCCQYATSEYAKTDEVRDEE